MILPFVCAFAGLFAHHQGGEALIHQTFANGEEGWAVVQAQGKGGKVSASHEVKRGDAAGSLKLEYSIAPGEITVASLPVADGALKTMQSMRFWVRADHNGAVVFTVQEKEGGRYNAMFFAPKDAWQQVELSMRDFTLSTDPGAPADPDGKLDPEKINSIAFTDLEQLLAQNPQVATGLGIVKGDHSLYLSEFEASSGALPDAFSAKPGEYRLDTYGRPQCSWVGIGGGTFSQISGDPLGEKGIKVDYHVGPTHLMGALKFIQRRALVGTKYLNLHLASAKACTLILQVEEEGGGKYNTVIELPGGSTAKDQLFAFSDLKASEDSHDTNAKLDLDQVKQIILIDVSGFVKSAEQDNTVWIGSIVAKK